MNVKAVLIYLNRKSNRQSMINKIEKGLKNKSINYTKDPEVEEFQKGFLENWDDLEKFKPSAEDLEGLEGEEKKQKIKELKEQFSEWVSSQDVISEGYAYAFEKKEQIKGHIAGAGRSVASKTKATIKGIVGNSSSKKVGRNQ